MSLLALALRRLLASVPTLFLIVIGVFLLLQFTPGDTVDALVAQMGGGDPAMAEEMRGVTWARDRLRQLTRQVVDREQSRLDELRALPVVRDPRTILDVRSDEVSELRQRARRHVGHRLDRAADDIGHQRARARSLSPLATLQRGYAVVQGSDGTVLTSLDRVDVGDGLRIRVADGRLHATVSAVDPDDSSVATQGARADGDEGDGND